MNKLSVTVITLNEEANIKLCLESVKEVADEIIIVDSGSTDKTLEIAKAFKPKVFFRKFDNYANQKNFAAQKATGNWIFSIDADEKITRELASQIRLAITSLHINGYLIPRRNFILGAEIKHTRWSPDRHIWLWKKNSGRWQGDVHEEVVVKGLVKNLSGAKLHYSYKTVYEFQKANVRYAKLQAGQLVKNGQQFSLIHFLVDPGKEFLIRFIYKLGFLDGWRGLILSILMAWFWVMVWLNVWKKIKNHV
jgi:glycosyltransferase involved in cell wall biosynthesis